MANVHLESLLLVNPGCPPTMLDLPKLYLRADVPAYAKARCQNGDKTFTSSNAVEFELLGAFDRMYNGSNCQYYVS